jgi:hypothetical protein
MPEGCSKGSLKMYPIIGRTLGAVFLSIALCGAAAAESGFSGNKEISPADAAAKLLQDQDAGGDTGLSKSLADPGSGNAESQINDQNVGGQTLEAELVNVPGANPVSVLNCSGQKVVIKAYNSNDTVVIVPFEAKTISNGEAASLKCKTKSCRLRVGTGKATDAMSGYLKLEKGFSKSSQSNLQQGC